MGTTKAKTRRKRYAFGSISQPMTLAVFLRVIAQNKSREAPSGTERMVAKR